MYTIGYVERKSLVCILTALSRPARNDSNDQCTPKAKGKRRYSALYVETKGIGRTPAKQFRILEM